MVRPFDDEDYPDFKEWHEKRGIIAVPKDCLPTRGFVVPGVAMGFLIQTDCKLGLIDFFITNPDVAKAHRRAALNEIGAAIEKRAKTIGIRYLKADSKHDFIKILAKLYGGSYIGEYTAFIKEI